jgi:hypothetical protein
MKGVSHALPEIAHGFQATIDALQSIDGREGLSFHTFSFPENRCVRLVLKNFGQSMIEAEVREELEALHLNVQAVMQVRRSARIRTPRRTVP